MRRCSPAQYLAVGRLAVITPQVGGARCLNVSRETFRLRSRQPAAACCIPCIARRECFVRRCRTISNDLFLWRYSPSRSITFDVKQPAHLTSIRHPFDAMKRSDGKTTCPLVIPLVSTCHPLATRIVRPAASIAHSVRKIHKLNYRFSR